MAFAERVARRTIGTAARAVGGGEPPPLPARLPGGSCALQVARTTAGQYPRTGSTKPEKARWTYCELCASGLQVCGRSGLVAAQPSATGIKGEVRGAAAAYAPAGWAGGWGGVRSYARSPGGPSPVYG